MKEYSDDELNTKIKHFLDKKFTDRLKPSPFAILANRTKKHGRKILSAHYFYTDSRAVRLSRSAS